MAFWGFEVVFADGSRARESDGVWDLVPSDRGVKVLRLVQVHDGGEVEVCAVEPAKGERVYFYNEVVQIRGGMGTLSAKAIGIVHQDECHELRLLMLPRLEGRPPVLQQRRYPRSELRLDDRALRSAAA